MDPTRRARERLAALEADGLLRRAPAISRRSGVRYEIDGRSVIGLCSNDYLGLAADPGTADPTTTDLDNTLDPATTNLRNTPHPTTTDLRNTLDPRTTNLRNTTDLRNTLDPATTSTDPPPPGAGASRLICGDLPCHRDLEARLATLVGADDAVLFPSGFQLNVGVLPTLLEPGDHVDSDALNHASLIDGMRLARVRPHILPHAQAPQPRPVRSDAVHWWITESIFSMDGDRLDPTAAQAHLWRGGSMIVDEAHALGLFERGQGWLGHHDLRPTVLVGTLSKAFGCAGAFVAASRPLCELVRNRARSFVFSTGTSPVLVAAISRALDRVTGPDGDARRERLWANVRHLAEALGLPQTELPSPILPIIIGDNALAVSLADRLLDRGWHVQAIRPPTVPSGTARLRLTVSAAHEPEHLDAFASDLRRLLADEGLPLRIERGLPPRSVPPHDARRHA